MNRKNPFISRLTPAQLEVLSGIRARNKARFGDDAFRMEEGDGDSGDGDKGGDGDGDKGGDSGDGDKGGDDAAEKLELSKLPKEVQDLVKKYRREAAEANGKAREEARQKAAEEASAAVIAKIGEALGLTKSETKELTSEELVKKLSEAEAKGGTAEAEAKQTKIELAVYRTASKKDVGGDPEALLDSRSFLAKVQALDPAAKDFNDKVSQAIKDAIKDNPKLKLQAGAGSSSADHSGGGGETGEKKSAGLTGAVAGHYGV